MTIIARKTLFPCLGWLPVNQLVPGHADANFRPQGQYNLEGGRLFLLFVLDDKVEDHFLQVGPDAAGLGDDEVQHLIVLALDAKKY